MLTALGGRLLYAGGKWRLYAAAWRSPSVTLGEDDLDGPIRLTTRQARRDLCNGVKGVYVSPDNYWQSSDYPVIEGASYLAEDGERMWRDFDLPYTTSAATAQRLAKIELERTRRQMATVWPCKLTAMRVQAGDVVRLSNTRFGWSNKTFEVVDWRFSLRGNENAPRIGIDLTLRESDANVYAWASAEEQQPAAAPLSNLPNPFDIPAPTGLTLASGTAELLLMGDGTVVSRIKANWTDSATAYIDDVEIQFKKAADSVWQSAPPVHKGGQEIFLSPVLDGVAYDVRIRSVSTLGSPSAWTTVTGHVVIGKTSPPEDVTGFSSAVNGGVVVFRWNPVGDADLAGYDIRYGAASSSWSAKTPLTTTTRGTQITTAAVPPGTWEFAINAVDTSGNASVNAALSSATVGNSNNLIASAPQAPGWPGTLSGFVKHWTGVLMPDCTMLASDMTDAELWDTFVAAPVTTATYTQAGEQALAIDGSPRLWAAVAAALGPGESTGAPLPHLEVATRTLAGSYGPWRPWTIGTEPCGAFKMRVGFNTAGGVVVLSEFTPTADAPFATESHSGLSVPLAGLVLTFDQPFQLAPNVQVTPVATGAQIGVATGVSNSGCTILLFTTAGTAASGTVNVTITGPR
ncbi:MAG: hypothetical protein HYU60_00060 [Magnetospirillum sp.]|nr:hypothetical protein [Magnetospirillum sp.]